MALPFETRATNDVTFRVSQFQFKVFLVVSVIASMLGISHLFASLYLSQIAPTASTSIYLNNPTTPAMSTSSACASSVTPFSIAYVTISNQELAQKLAKQIVENKLAACVNIVPKVVSVYEWKGNIETDDEALMMLKTRTSRVQELVEFVKKNHPYEVCEVISTPIQQGNEAYLKWMGNVVPDKECA